MSKFNELCLAFETAHNKFQNHRKSTIDFAEKLWDSLIEYFEIPHDNISLFKIGANNELSIISPSMHNGLTLLTDGRWAFALGITLNLTNNREYEDIIVITFIIRRDKQSKYYLSTNFIEPEQIINPEEKSDFLQYFERLKDEIIKKYASEFNNFEEHKNVRKIGFNNTETEEETT